LYSRKKDYSNYKHKCPTCEFGSMTKFTLMLDLFRSRIRNIKLVK
jgi:hypothetical protein